MAVSGAPHPRVAAARVATPPRIDGILDDEAWQGPALSLGEWLTYNPLNGEKLAQTTDGRAVHDDRAIYFAFRCRDPEPDKTSRSGCHSPRSASRAAPTFGWGSCSGAG